MKTTKPKHTPEPWRIGLDAVGPFVQQGPHGHSKWRVANMIPSDPSGEANAQRIVDCVNACEGIADPSAVPELLTACESFLRTLTTPEQRGAYDAALDAIAKARGES